MKIPVSRTGSSLFSNGIAILIIGSFIAWSLPYRARADAGDLNHSFGSGGKVITDFFGVWDEAEDVAIQKDGKIVAAGFTQTFTTDDDFAVARFNATGELDQTFGTGGKVTLDFFSGTDHAEALEIQPDGRILLAGFARGATGLTDFALARLNNDGSLDSSFGTGGKVTTGLAGAYAQARAMALQPDGSIVVGGTLSGPVGPGFAITRYLPNGTFDTTFGTSGWAITKFLKPKEGLTIYESLSALAVQQDGRIVAAGSAGSPQSDFRFAVVRYLSDGTLDQSFGSRGKVTIPFFGNGHARGLAIQPDGKIIIVGVIGNGITNKVEFGVVRLNRDGSLDSDFGNGGKVTEGFSAFSAAANSVAVQADSKIVVTGSAEFKKRNDAYADTAFAVARFNRDGSLDNTFGSNGRVTQDFGELSDDASAVAIEPDGRLIVAGGSASFQTAVDFAVVCYENNIRFPQISNASTSGKKLYVEGQNFDEGAAIYINGAKQKTSYDSATRLVGKKSGKKVKSGDRIKIVNSDNTESNEHIYP
jgi:uncharacterized delta-60 repeat protein